MNTAVPEYSLIFFQKCLVRTIRRIWMLYILVSVSNMAIVKLCQGKNGPYMQALWCICLRIFVRLFGSKTFPFELQMDEQISPSWQNNSEYLNVNYTHKTLQVSYPNGNLSNDGLSTKDVTQESNVHISYL